MIDLFPAAARLSSLIEAVPESALSRPTPCSEYSVGDLLDHIAGVTVAFGGAAVKSEGESASMGPQGNASNLDQHWRASVPERLEALARAWQNPDAWSGMTKVGGQDIPGEVAGIVTFGELSVHGWDLSRATGLPFEPDPVGVTPLFDLVRRTFEAGLAPREPAFGPVVPVGDDAPVFDQTLGLLGRDPGWSPTLRPRQPHDFDAMYQGTPPWDIGRPQPAFVQLANAGVLRGHVLDVGCGTGEHALMAAELGLEAVGIDTASGAITAAERKAAERGLHVRFVVGNALELESLNELFDTVLDCGLFHIFEDDDRARFVKSLRAATRPGGHYFMLCFSDRQPGDWGPRRISVAEIESSFGRGWKIDSIEPAKIDVNISPEGVLAWLAVITRI